MQKIKLLSIALANLSLCTVSRQLAQYSAVIKFAFYKFIHALLISLKYHLSLFTWEKQNFLIPYHFSLGQRNA